MLDTQRDTLALPLIRRVVERQVPLLAVCRGIQELNVALGGTLHMVLEEVDGLMAHRVGKSKPREEQYQPLHDIDVVGGGALRAITGLAHYRVNSVHGQGIARLAPGPRDRGDSSGWTDRGGECPARHGHAAWRAVAPRVAVPGAGLRSCAVHRLR